MTCTVDHSVRRNKRTTDLKPSNFTPWKLSRLTCDEFRMICRPIKTLIMYEWTGVFKVQSLSQDLLEILLGSCTLLFMNSLFIVNEICHISMNQCEQSMKTKRVDILAGTVHECKFFPYSLCCPQIFT